MEGNRDGEGNFCRGKEADIALFLRVTRIRKIRKDSEENWSTLPETGRSQTAQATNLETQKQKKRIEIYQQ